MKRLVAMIDMFLPPKANLSFDSEPGKFTAILEGRRIASGASSGRKVRTPQGAMPRNLAPPTQGSEPRIHAGGKLKGFSTESATEN